MEKCFVPVLEQGLYKMSLQHLVLPESKEVLKKKQNAPTLMGVYEGHISPQKELPVAKAGTI